MRKWKDIADLADQMKARAQAKKPVYLSPDTALFVALKLQKVDAKPTRDEVALMICKRGSRAICDAPCYECRGKANIVVEAYGCSLEKSG